MLLKAAGSRIELITQGDIDGYGAGRLPRAALPRDRLGP